MKKAILSLILSLPIFGQTAVIKTNPAPSWGTWQAWKVGATNGLDGTSGTITTWNWSCVNFDPGTGPIACGLVFTSPTSAITTVTNVRDVGQYLIQLCDNAAHCTTMPIGAVNYDSNGVVINADPNVTKLFGPQIAFGQNPFGLADERNLKAVTSQVAYQAANNDFGWTTTGTGTVAYQFSGVGGVGNTPTTICGSTSCNSTGISQTDTSISVVDASKLSLSSLPTWILLGNSEMVRVIATTATTGNATLTIAYDGRGMSGNTVDIGGYPNTVAAQPWPFNTSVGEYRIQGTSTLFGTDASKPICPAGLPGPPGPVVYSTGTVTLSAGSTTVTGSGTTWTSGNGVVPKGYIRVTATHGGTAFIFWRQIVTVTDSTHLVLDRPAPTGIDGSAFSYKITSPIYLSLEFTWTDGHVARTLQNGVGCESETVMFALATHDVPAIDSTVMSGVKYSYKTTLTEVSAFGTFDPNFYAAGMMARRFWHRSGLKSALNLANSIDEYWVRDPMLADGIAPQGLVLAQGGGVIGAMACLALQECSILTWANVEPFAEKGRIQATACNAYDTREGSYQQAWLILAAMFDTNVTNQMSYSAALGTSTPSLLSRAQGCVRTSGEGYSGSEVGSFFHTNVWAPNIASPNALTLTNGSTAVTGSGFNNGSASVGGYCYGVDIITLTVTNGSSTATVASGTLTQQSLIYFADGNNKVGVFEYTGAGGAGTTVLLSGKWTGASGTFSAMSTLGGPIVAGGQYIGGYGAIWTDNTENFTNNRALEKVWPCKFNSPSSLTLFRPWDAASGSSYHISYYNVGAGGQQPFFTGILATTMRWANYLYSGFQSLLSSLGNWYGTYGYDATNSHGTFYDTVFQACGDPTDVADNGFNSIHGFEGCGAVNAGKDQARYFTAEGGAALIQYFLANPTPARRALVDQAYGGSFGKIAYCAASVLVYCDDTFGSNMLDADLAGPKYPGFWFGMGGFYSDAWPAIRLMGLGTAATISGSTRIRQ